MLFDVILFSLRIEAAHPLTSALSPGAGEREKASSSLSPVSGERAGVRGLG
jgi:hypothetical protein